MDNRNEHISTEERKKRFLMRILIGILIVIFITIIIIMIPKGNNDDVDQTEYKSKVAEELEKNKEKKKEEKDDRDKSKVSIVVKTDTLTPEGAVIAITDKNENKYTWIPNYSIQQKVDGKWEEMILLYPDNMNLPDKELLNESGYMEQSLVWSNKYGVLEPGKYRIVKVSNDIKFYAEFEIE